MREYDPIEALTFLTDRTELPNVAVICKKMLEFPDDRSEERRVGKEC